MINKYLLNKLFIVYLFLRKPQGKLALANHMNFSIKKEALSKSMFLFERNNNNFGPNLKGCFLKRLNSQTMQALLFHQIEKGVWMNIFEIFMAVSQGRKENLIFSKPFSFVSYDQDITTQVFQREGLQKDFKLLFYWKMLITLWNEDTLRDLVFPSKKIYLLFRGWLNLA